MSQAEAVGSVTDWIEQFRSGNQEAVEQIWRRYCARLVGLAKKQLRAMRPSDADPEGVADEAFCAFCSGLEQGRFRDLVHRDDLWRLLSAIVFHVAQHEAQKQLAQKRGGDRTIANDPAGLSDVPSREPTPEEATAVLDTWRYLLARLSSDRQREIVRLHMEGCTLGEIAGRIRCALRTVERDHEKALRILAAEAERLGPEETQT